MLHLPRLVIAAPRSGEGKTSVTAALLSVFMDKGKCVVPYKVGPDYLDPAFHSAITGLSSRNLDSWLFSEDTVQNIFLQSFLASSEKKVEALAIIEGVMGLFDGQGIGHKGSTAHVAEVLQSPVVLVINGKGMSRSVAALVSGFANFYPAVSVAGIIFNRLSGEKQYRLLQAVVAEYTGIPCFGFLPENKNFYLPSRHLGLLSADEIKDFEERVKFLAMSAAEYIDVNGLLDLAASAVSFNIDASEQKILTGQDIFNRRSQPLSCLEKVSTHELPVDRVETQEKLRIGILQDEAFSFYYQDNLDFLSRLGADLVYCSPLHDQKLPDNLDGLYLGGGYPEEYAAELEANGSFHFALKRALEQGLPAYAEGGGMMYLTTAIITAAGKSHAMAGFLPCLCRMTGRLQKFGYVTVTTRCATLLGAAGLSYRAHEFHYSELLLDEYFVPDPVCSPVYTSVCSIAKPDGRSWEGGMMRENVFALYPHLHFASCPEAAINFVQFCARKKTEFSSCLI